MIDSATALPVALGFVLGAALAAAGLLLALGRARGAAREAAGRADSLGERLAEERERREAVEARLRDESSRREQAERAAARLEQQGDEQARRFEEQAALLRRAEERLADTFASLGSKALAANNERFLELARQSFETLMAESKGDSEKRQQAIESLVAPIKEQLERQGSAVAEIEKKREAAYSGLEKQIQQIADSHRLLGDETRKLVSALRRPEQRGRWGELQLKNCVELAGMTERCDFDLQHSVGSRDDGLLRPDMVVRLPGGGSIVVDSKVALDAYLDALDPEADRAACIRRHAEQVDRHCRQLAAKRYWEQFDHAPQLVVLFMPLESALVAALEAKPELHANAMRENVLVATPTLLVALLRAVAYGWQQEAIAENAREIAREGRELYDRLATYAGHVEGVGRGLDRAVRAYNDGIGSLERMVLPSARRLKELHATSRAELEGASPIDRDVRAIGADELSERPSSASETPVASEPAALPNEPPTARETDDSNRADESKRADESNRADESADESADGATAG